MGMNLLLFYEVENADAALLGKWKKPLGEEPWGLRDQGLGGMDCPSAPTIGPCHAKHSL